MTTNLLGARTTRHLAKSVLLEETGSPLIIRLIVWFGLGVVVLFLIWASVMNLEEVARAQGEIIPSGHIKKIQHLGGGTISEILVKEGEKVTTGQPLIRLNPLLSLSQVEQARLKRGALLVRRARLQALLDGKEPNFSAFEKEATVSEERRLWQQLSEGRQAATSSVAHEVAQARAEIGELAEQERSMKKQLALIGEELTMRSDLLDKGLNSRTVFLGLKRRQAEVEGELGRLPFQKQKLEHRILTLESQGKERERAEVGKWSDEMTMVTRDLEETEEVLNRHQINLKELELRAPVAGIVHRLSKHTLGEVIASGDTVLEIVPEERRLLAETRISPRDVGHVQVGQKVILKFTTYEFSRYGGIEGVMKEVSPSSFLDEKGNSYFKGIVELNQEFVGRHVGENLVTPGLTLQAEITTGKKTVMQYLLKPLYASARDALRER
ncbi:MAG: HlyD family type I secretion periplasmic adaptor subunit [Magnetococcales bacterium]|nr:HlyD family type I secretion periplasmic adaptor subunit [Magnetococcales bacterium]